MANKDYYEILGVSRNATDQEIKTAYKKAVMKYHPDKFANKPEAEKKQAEEKMKEVNYAYGVLSNPEKKQKYDQFGSEDGPSFTGGGSGGFGGFSDFGDIFSQFFGGGFGSSSRNQPIDGDDITMRLEISFDEAIKGCEKSVKVYRTEKCPDCKGSGASDPSKIQTCPVCHGSGVVTVTQNTIFGRQTVRTKCSNCGGKGKVITDKCKTCRGSGVVKKERIIPVTIPAGADNNQTITYYNEGEVGINGGSNGRLVIVLSVKPHELFVRDGYDLYVKVPISFTDACLGGKITVPTTNDKNITLTIPAGTQSGTKFRVKGYGVKYLRKEQYGDMYVTVEIETPQKLNSKQQSILKEFEESVTAKQTDKKRSFISKWINKEK